jgi:hypothetical protein
MTRGPGTREHQIKLTRFPSLPPLRAITIPPEPSTEPDPSTSLIDMSSCSSSLPDLPLEVHEHILRFCDPPTLSRTSRVSLAFLELSIPLLRGEIHIEGLEKMEKLLCSRVSGQTSSSHVLCDLASRRRS